MVDQKKIVLGISCGDISGIGLEILIKSCLNNKLFDFCIPILYAPFMAVNFYKKLYSLDFNYHVIKNVSQASSNKLNIITTHQIDNNIKPGVSCKVNGLVAIDSLKFAVEDLKNNIINVLVTLPINKYNVSLVQPDFVGHTEYLSTFFKSKSLMLLCANNLRVATVTNHVPISKVSSCITPKIIKEKLIILIKLLQIDFLIKKPKIAVLSLNPHAGDNGLIGHEDEKIVKPVIDDFSKNGNLVYGPYSADGFFGSGDYVNFDAVLGMYHDQALIPFKTLSFGKGVNYTAGLPCIRVSPDHGVGYDIAGKEKASVSSFLSACFLAKEIYYNRSIYKNSVQKKDDT